MFIILVFYLVIKLFNNYSFAHFVNGIRIWQNKEMIIKRAVLIQAATEY